MRWLLRAPVRLMATIIGAFLGWAVKRGYLYFAHVSAWLGMMPFTSGLVFRVTALHHLLAAVGDEVIINNGVTFEETGTTIGRDVWISAGCYVDLCTIEDSVLIGPHAVLLSGGRVHRTERLDIPIKSQGNVPKVATRIGTGAWIGAAACVMADVGEHAIVGAGSVVTKPVPAFAVVAGNPARFIRDRRDAPVPQE